MRLLIKFSNKYKTVYENPNTFDWRPVLHYLRQMDPFLNIDDLTQREVAPGFFGKFIHSEKITVAYWEVKQGAEIPFHDHVHEMMVNVIEGKLELTIGDKTEIIQFGTVGIIPSNVPHKAKAVTDCKIIDVFYPVREDYK
ncbi:MAG: cupin domain-containing protein [Chitinophagales bacterium]